MKTMAKSDDILLDDEIEINMTEAIRSVLKRIILVVLAAVIAYQGAQYYTYTYIIPKYEATAMLYMFTSPLKGHQYNSVRISNLMLEDYEIIGKTRTVLGEIMEENGISGTVEELQKELTLEVIPESHLLKITMHSTDPVKCRDVANLLADRIRDMIAEDVGGTPPSVVTRAILPQWSYYPNVSKIAKLSAILAAFAVCVISVLYDYQYRTIRDAQDVESLLGLEVLGEIPAKRSLAQRAARLLFGRGHRRRKHARS